MTELFATIRNCLQSQNRTNLLIYIDFRIVRTIRSQKLMDANHEWPQCMKPLDFFV